MIYTYKLHDERVLWPEHKPLAEVLELQATTPEYIWETTYQGNATNPSGNVFKLEWWKGQNRFRESSPVARFISFDTAASEAENAAYTAWTVGELQKDYSLAIVEMGRVRVAFPQLLEAITDVASRYNDPLLRNVLIEYKSSGIQAVQTLQSATQTLQQAANPWLRRLITPFDPKVSKIVRWNQAATWCKLGCVLLPYPGPSWLYAAEQELYAVPGAPELDQADAFSQLIIFTENLLSEGYRARSRK